MLSAVLPDLPACHLEIGGQIDRDVALAETFRNTADQGSSVAHLVIETKIVTWDQVDPESLLFLPMMPSQLRCFGQQFGLGNGAVPKRFGGSFEFPVFANPRIAEIMGLDLFGCLHGFAFLKVCGSQPQRVFCEGQQGHFRPCSGSHFLVGARNARAPERGSS